MNFLRLGYMFLAKCIYLYINIYIFIIIFFFFSEQFVYFYDKVMELKTKFEVNPSGIVIKQDVKVGKNGVCDSSN